MKSGYQPDKIESKHYQRWEKENYFVPTGDGSNYCIVIPPPNITGTLHMGHAFQITIMDALTRYHRMGAYKTLWQPGTDHAGISTEMVVERLLNTENKTKKELGRDAFVKHVWAWKKHSGNRISEQMRRLGASLDWSRERFTMDPGLSRAVIRVFVQLYEEDLIYRGKRLVHWDPKLHTVLSDLEVLTNEEQGKLWRLRYPLAKSDNYLVVATTRPETMLGDTAVAVHPKDTRYSHLIGTKVELPLVNRIIPIIADDYVDPEFGTGCVKITPAHDFNDYELGVRHGLAAINIFDKNAHINDSAPERYMGLDRFEARKRIVEDLDKAGLLDGIKKHTLMVPRGDRSGVIVEPFLTDQWYVRTEPLAKAAIEAVESGNVRFVPESWSKTYFEWMRNIQDWCISRQLWWGHRIPAWYDPDGNVYIAHDEAEVRKKYDLADSLPLHQDEDVLDTWFSSALWPFSTLGWPEDTPELSNFYPTTVLVTGFDIIFFWVARMIMMGIKFMGKVPFREVYVHGLIRDHAGQKMSKTKGNVIDPIDIIDGVKLKTLLTKRTEGLMQQHLAADIEKATRKEFPDGISPFGADALRFTFASLATGGRDVNFDFGRVEGYRNFCNKLWNASQYVFFNTSKQELGHLELTAADRWIRSQFRKTIEKVNTAFHCYRLDLAASALYDFTWHEFCDWYLELTKSSLKNPDANEAQLNGTKATLVEILGALLRLLHPIMPFITEELWLDLCERTDKKSDTIMIEAIPSTKDFASDAKAEAELDWIKEFVSSIRQIRGEMRLNPSQVLPVKVSNAQADDRARIEKFKVHLISLAKLESIEFVENADAISGTATSLMGKMRLLIPLVGIINLEDERNRLKKQRNQAEENLEKCRKKLENAQFLKNAPEDVVTKEHKKRVKFIQRLEQLNNQLTMLDEII